MKHNLLNISGGATKIVGLLASVKTIIECGYKPTVITGVSSGSILAVIVAMGKLDEAERILKGFTLRSFMDVVPVNKKGRLSISSYIRLLLGFSSLGIQNVPKILRQIITKADFDKFIDYRNGYPDVYILATNAITGRAKGWRVKELTYENYLSVVAASCSIPVFTQPIIVGNEIYFDGSLRNHAGGAWALTNLNYVFGKCVSVFSRPNPKENNTKHSINSIFNILSSTLSILNTDVSENDEIIEKMICKKMGIRQVSIHLPLITKGFFDTDKKTMQELAETAKQTTIKQWGRFN